MNIIVSSTDKPWADEEVQTLDVCITCNTQVPLLLPTPFIGVPFWTVDNANPFSVEALAAPVLKLFVTKYSVSTLYPAAPVPTDVNLTLSIP